MIQITTQMRVLVAIEPVDGRKGIEFPGAPVPGKARRESVLGLCFRVPEPQRNRHPVTGL